MESFVVTIAEKDGTVRFKGEVPANEIEWDVHPSRPVRVRFRAPVSDAMARLMTVPVDGSLTVESLGITARSKRDFT